MGDLQGELTSLLNRHSAENASDTPDFVLAQYLIACLNAWNEAIRVRDKWYGFEGLSARVKRGTRDKEPT